MTKRGWGLFLALSVIWGVPYLLIRIAVQDIDPLVVAFGRTAIGSLILLPIALYHGGLAPLLRRWKPLLLFTVVEIAGPWLLLGHAETRLTSSTAGLLIAVVPLTTAVILASLGHERMDARRMLGLGIGFGGVAGLVGLDVRLAGEVARGGPATAGQGAQQRHLGGAEGLVDALVLEPTGQPHHGGSEGVHGGCVVALAEVRHVL